ncbi:reverse transcriptase domain-containing protein [Tanacetum coccineum]
MQTRSSSKFISEPSTNPTSTILKRRNRRLSIQRVEPFSLVETPVVTMADQRTMAKLLRAPTEGYAEAIIVPPIPAEHFELKHSLINLAWDRFKDLLHACLHHSFTELHQLDTFYNGLNPSDQDSLNSTAGASNVDSSEIASVVASVVTSAMTAMFKQHHVTPSPASAKAVKESCITCGGAHSYRQCPATDGNTFLGYQDNIQGYVSAAAVNYNQGNTGYRPQSVANQIRPLGFDQPTPIDEPVVAPNPKPSIPYPLRANKQKLHEKDDNLASKFVEIFKELHFKLSFADALLHMPKFASMFKSLLNNKEKLFDLAKTLVNENCSAVILKKLPEKLGDPDKFLIPCDFLELVECLALADLDRSTTSPSGIAKDVFVKVGKFHFPADFIVVDYVVDPRVPLILGRLFFRMTRALIDIYGEKLNLRVDDEAITFKVGQTSRYSYNDVVLINRIDVIDVACEEYAQEVLGFSDNSTSGNPTPSLDPILSTYSLSLTPFEEGDFILEEIKACLTNDSIPPGIVDDNFDPKGDLLLLEKLLNDDPSSPLPLKELHVEELKIVKSSIDCHPELELKDLPSHLEYEFLEGTDKLPVIIAKNIKEDEKVRLLKVLKSHKRAIT